ncbi:ABC transporter permease [Spirochaeta isovalerica]|uniref:ABC-type lipoprotein release transport system permease subunit n=1 Tax=Spirochaeta isovalerica TaxID=150 RepID=A0A841RGA8_9SPIO|nr:FtsX-like permease family protein [Spirochaeta isovalerica]MBB6482616.1 ABC-type lipoprotein release transport system permease subunit [Spirochaeta isovalerica]
MFLLKMALLNLARHKRRTLITAFAISFGVVSFIFIDSMLKGADSESVRNLKWYETSSAKILHKEYWENRVQKSLNYNFSGSDEIIARLNGQGINGTERTEFYGEMILNKQDFGEDGNISVQVTAINPLRDEDVFHFRDTLVDGRFLNPGDEGILLGSWLAEDIGAEVGSVVTIVARGRGGFFEAMDLELLGIVNCPNPTVNRRLIMMPLDTADDYLFLEGTVSEIDIKEEDIDSVRAILRDYPDLVVLGFEDLAKDYLSMMEMEKSSSGIILFLIFIIAAVGISNTMLMTMYERFREIGMMRAMGMADGKIRIMFLLEAAGIGFLGALVGILFGIFAVFFLIHVGIDYGFATREFDLVYRVQAIFRGEWNWSTMALSALASSAISTLVAIFPINRGLKLDISSCLKHQ